MRAVLDERNFGECSSDSLGMDHVLSRSRTAHDANRSFEDDEPPTRLRAGEEDYLVGGEPDLDAAARKRHDHVRTGFGEQWKVRQVL
jgi:hypothetical protein